MKNFFGLFLFCCQLFFFHYINAQDSSAVTDSAITSDLKDSSAIDHVTQGNEKFYLFKNLIHNVFGGYGQATKFNPRQQMFDFMEMGRPQYVAPLNMYPHQMIYVYDAFSLNEHTNGMFNTRFLSADHIENIDYAINPYAVGSVVINPLQVSEEQAYTRLKYYEGDVNYSDLDIFFARDLAKNVRIQLAGFNKGYGGGFPYNSRHTGVAYNTKLSYKLDNSFQGEFSWLRNHEISGMGSPSERENFTYRSDAERFATRFFYALDSTAMNRLSLGLLYGYNFHRNRSFANDYYSRQKSDNYRAFLSADFSDSLYQLNTVMRMDNYVNRGTVFKKDFSDLVLSADASGRYQLSRYIYTDASTGIKYLDGYNPAVSLSASVTVLHLPLVSSLKSAFSQRLPNPVERSVSYENYSGNKDLDPESWLSTSLHEKWSVTDNFSLQAETGFGRLKNEIIFTDSTFSNGADRSWFFLNGQGSYSFWLFTVSAGGQVLSGKKYISPKHSVWSEITVHGNLFGGTIILDLTGFTQWNDRHDLIEYNPQINRFYRGSGKNLSYMNVGFKAVATVSDAELFMEMDNLLEQEISYINGYSRYITRVRFGVNWIFWD